MIKRSFIIREFLESIDENTISFCKDLDFQMKNYFQSEDLKMQH